VVSAGELTLENRHLRLELHPRTGCPKSLLLKRNGCELIASAGRAAVYEDRSDTWGHGVARWNREIGSFEVTRIRVVENGPVVAVVRVESAYGDSRLVQEFALHLDLDRIEVRATVDWREKHKLFKLRFPTAIDRVTATTEAPYGFVERETRGDEEPCLSWIDLSGLVGAARAGLSLLSDSKYSVDISAADIGLTVLRSPIYAHHDPLVPEEDGVYRYIDQGPHDFSYALVPHTATWRESGIVKRAAELNQRPIPLIESFHSGPLAPSGSAVAVDAEAVAVTVLKRAEDGDDLIIRAVETLGVDTAASIQLPAWGRTIETRFGPLEIKTFRIPRDPSRPAREVDLLEL
jgi:alpha-mannosidase